MRRLIGFLVLVLLAASVASTPAAAQETPTPAPSCEFPTTRVDGGGTTVTVDDEPQRVVTLNPSAAQTMWEIGAREKVVGLTKYAEYLDGASERELVSSETDIVVFERVVALEPDLVLAPNTVSNETVSKLRETGITVYHFPPEYTLEDVYAKIHIIGELTGECDGAHETVMWMNDRVAIVEQAVRDQRHPDVLYLFFGYTAGSNTFIHELIETAGGNNIAADIGISWYQQISHEVVIESNPEWIILNSNDPAVPREDAFNATTAVRENQTIVIPIEHLNQPAPRVVYALTTLAQALHPDAYAAANSTTTPRGSPTPEPTPSVTATETRSPTGTESPGQPGFGLTLPFIVLLVYLGKLALD